MGSSPSGDTNGIGRRLRGRIGAPSKRASDASSSYPTATVAVPSGPIKPFIPFGVSVHEIGQRDVSAMARQSVWHQQGNDGLSLPLAVRSLSNRWGLRLAAYDHGKIEIPCSHSFGAFIATVRKTPV